MPTKPIFVRRTLTRDMPDRSRVVARLEMRIAADGERHVRTLSPAFSLTGEIYEAHGTWSGAARQRNGHEWDCGGQCHDEILRVFPQLTRFAAMHLSDPLSGEPVHALANGWYFYAGSRSDLRATERYTGHDRVYARQLAERGLTSDDPEEYTDETYAREIYCYQTACKILRVDYIPRGLDRASFGRFVDDLRELWRYEAMDARAFIESLPE